MANEFDPRLVIMSFGPLVLNGYADGEMISVSYLGDGVSAVVGGQGAGILIDDHDNSAEVTVRIFAAHLAGQITMSALLKHHTAGNIALPLSIVSVTTGEKLAGGLAKIKKKPDASFSKGEAPVREIVFVSASLSMQAAVALVP